MQECANTGSGIIVLSFLISATHCQTLFIKACMMFLMVNMGQIGKASKLGLFLLTSLLAYLRQMKVWAILIHKEQDMQIVDDEFIHSL